MRPREVWDCRFAWGVHPCDIVSNGLRCALKRDVVVLKATTLRAGVTRDAQGLEAIPDESDGLDWRTLVTCDLMFTVPKTDLSNRRGAVSQARRRDTRGKCCKPWRW